MSSKIITREDGQPYLIRTTLFKCRWFQVNLHKILLSDYDCLHDHPWAFWSIILKGGYWERYDYAQTLNAVETAGYISLGSPEPIRKKWFGPGCFLRRPATWKHSLDIPAGKTALTLVVTFKKIRRWGFWTSKGWIHFTDYKSTATCE